VPVVLPYVDAPQAALLRSELAFQNHVAAGSAYAALPRGAIHADLFRDNVMFEQGRLTGFFDFYFAGVDSWLFDLAVCLNDWCIDQASGAHDAERALALLDAYAAVRPLAAAERQLLPAMLRAGALRFWISRLWDFHLPRQAALLQAHDPAHFERVLRRRIAQPVCVR
jgi:homoserine kinase type II